MIAGNISILEGTSCYSLFLLIHMPSMLIDFDKYDNRLT
jgi:hypothetical protein